MASASAMLSKPSLESSAGSRVVGSISRANRSRIELAYSVRFRRCRPVVPGFGLAAAALSKPASNCAAKASRVARSGLGIPLGGIIPERIFRTTFSQVSALLPG